MITKRLLAGAAIALALAALVRAESTLTGKWQGETKIGTRVLLDVKATDTALTGTLTVDGQPFTISSGKVVKNTFTFTANDTGFSGELVDDQINIWMDSRGRDSTAVLTRVKS